MTLQRDAFIAVHKDKNIFFLSADFGADTLDSFRAEHPEQFVHCGISEQHMIDMAAGLALSGKKVYVYAMGPFLALRCYEQIKCLAMMDQAVTLISTGVGLGYADSGPTHYLTEDIACLRAINGIEVITPADSVSTAEVARLSLKNPKLRYIRLDREDLPTLYTSFENEQGFCELEVGEDVCILSSGYMLHRVMEADLVRAGVVDLFRIKPINVELLNVLDRYSGIVTVEEQCLSGGFGSAVLEFMVDNHISKPVRRLGLPERYYFENGGRNRLLDAFGLSVRDICSAVMALS
jgi:transketolase